MIQFESELYKFSKEVEPYLLKEPSLHSQMLSLIKRYQELNKPMNLLLRLGEVVGIQTEKERALLFSKCSEVEAQNFATKLLEKKISLPGINGPIPAVDAFADFWCRETGLKKILGLNLRLFELTEVSSPKKTSGHFRFAEEKDEALLLKWMKEFHYEAVPHDPLASDEALLKAIKNCITEKGYFLWEDRGEVVCWVASTRQTQREGWIAPVYTPKHLRGKGYASSLVAVASQAILDKGKVALLFTDLANPTSNSIYQKIGYKPLADFRHWIFE